MTDEEINKIKEKIKGLAEKYNLSFMALFGSQAVGNSHSKSDIDIAVFGKSSLDMHNLTIDLYDFFKREDVEVVDIGSASPTMMYVVVRDGKLLYENEFETFLKWKLYAIWVWLDTAWLRRLRDKKMIEWAKTV